MQQRKRNISLKIMDIKINYNLLLTDLTTKKCPYCSFLFFIMLLSHLLIDFFLWLVHSFILSFIHWFIHFVSSHNIKFTLLTTKYKNSKLICRTIHINDDSNKIFLVQDTETSKKLKALSSSPKNISQHLVLH